MSSSMTSSSATASVTSASSQPTQYRPVGIVLAIGSGLLIGTSFVLKKKGLLRSQAGHAAGEGVAYLKSPMWWSGMTLMICGELCNFGAYAFVEAILVTPLGALSVVITAILSHFFLKENLTLFGWIGCAQCILGAIIIALNGPQEQSVTTIIAFRKLFLAPWFLAYGSVCIAVALVIIFFFAPRYGKKSMLWYISVCSLIGGISVSCTQGLGACIVTSIRGDNQFKNWFIYFLLAFVTVTLLTELFYLNVALALFNTAMVIPTYYVLFTFCTLVTSVILYEGLHSSAAQIITIVLGFLVICTGIFILQMSKVDPTTLKNVDRKTTILLQAARQEVEPRGGLEGENANGDDEEKIIEKTEEPNVDVVAGRFGALSGVITREIRRRATIAHAERERRMGSTPSVAGNNITGSNMGPKRPFIPGLNTSSYRRNNNNHSNTNLNNSDGRPPNSRLLSGERFVAGSPMAGTPASEMRNPPSIKYADSYLDTKENANIDEDKVSEKVRSLDSSSSASHHSILKTPPAALVATSDTSLAILNLPSANSYVAPLDGATTEQQTDSGTADSNELLELNHNVEKQ